MVIAEIHFNTKLRITELFYVLTAACPYAQTIHPYFLPVTTGCGAVALSFIFLFDEIWKKIMHRWLKGEWGAPPVFTL